MKILIGYAQRSGSTLLQHILSEHSQISSYSDVNSLFILPALLSGYEPTKNICVKPSDNYFLLLKDERYYEKFDKFIWIARDPRDSYLSAFEIKFAYFLWLPGRKLHGVDIGILHRWRMIYKQYFQNRKRWHLIRYEDLVTKPEKELRRLFKYLELPYESVFPFKNRFNILAGGDPKLHKTKTIHKRSVARYLMQMPKLQQKVFKRILGWEMKELGYG
jgi:hypothetical protein